MGNRHHHRHHGGGGGSEDGGGAKKTYPSQPGVFNPYANYGRDKKKPYLNTDVGKHDIQKDQEGYYNYLLDQTGLGPDVSTMPGATPFEQWMRSSFYDMVARGYNDARLQNPKLQFQQYMESAFAIPHKTEQIGPQLSDWKQAQRGPVPHGNAHGPAMLPADRLQAHPQVRAASVALAPQPQVAPRVPSLGAYMHQAFTPQNTGNPFTSQSAPLPGQQQAIVTPQPRQAPFGGSGPAGGGLPGQRMVPAGQHGGQSVHPAHQVQSPIMTMGKGGGKHADKHGVGLGATSTNANKLMKTGAHMFRGLTPEQRGTYMSGYSFGPARWSVY